MKTTTELEQENAAMRAELDAARAVLRDLSDLTDFISRTYPEAAGMKSTVTAAAEITRLRAALQKIMDGGYAPGADTAHPAIRVARETLNPNPRPERHYPR